MSSSQQIHSVWLDEPHRLCNDSAVAMGSFDGIHMGHKHIITRLKTGAEKSKLNPVLLTFDPHPRLALSQDISLLTTVPERELLLRKSGLRFIVHIRFTQQFAETSPDDFIDKYIIHSLDTKMLIVGYDHHFGKDRQGNPETLKAIGLEEGFPVEIIPPVKIDGVTIKSSTIRELISRGEIEKANRFLGHPYLVLGKAIPGRGIGSHIGYPTANIEYYSYKLLPRDGVYSARVALSPFARERNAIVYVGRAPTFGLPKRMFEVHILDYDGSSLYGRNIATRLHYFIRSDRSFKSLDGLRRQIERDIEKARHLLSDIR